MSTNPASLLAVRELFQKRTGLKANALGIAPDKLHDGGYHCGSDRVRRVDNAVRDYSVNESSRDRNGLTLDAAALDIGDYTITVKGKRYGLDHLNTWLVAQCRANAADARDIREIIYRSDSKTVKRWDRLGIRSSGDSSHLWHTHISYHRDGIKAGRDQAALFRRYFAEIGLLAGKDASMQLDDKLTYVKADDVPYAHPTTTVRAILPSTHYYVLQTRNEQRAEAADAKLRDEAILAAVTGGGQGQVLAAIAAEGERTRKLLDAQAAAEAQRDAEMLELVRRVQAGEVDARAVVDEIGARLTGQA